MTVVLIVGAFSVGGYCGRGTGRCSCGEELDGEGCWPAEIWKDYGWDNGCEEYIKPDFFRNPVNALSNTGFVVVGMWVLGIAWEDHGRVRLGGGHVNLLVGNPILSVLFSLCFMWCGVGSFLFHASSTRISHHLDMVSVDTLILFPLPYLLVRMLKLERTYFVPLTVLGMISAVGVPFMRMWELNWGNSFVAVPAIGGTDFFLSLVSYPMPDRTPRSLILWVTSLSGMLLSFGFRSIDTASWACRKTSVYQGHAVWHVGASGSIFLFYLFLRAENNSKNKERGEGGWVERPSPDEYDKGKEGSEEIGEELGEEIGEEIGEESELVALGQARV